MFIHYYHHELILHVFDMYLHNMYIHVLPVLITFCHATKRHWKNLWPFVRRGCIEDVVTKLDTKIMTAETEFNSSLNTYNTFANATETLANNVSKFQALIQERYDKNLPFMLLFFCVVLCLTFGTSWWGASVFKEGRDVLISLNSKVVKSEVMCSFVSCFPYW